jgi:hypothetical protein
VYRLDFVTVTTYYYRDSHEKGLVMVMSDAERQRKRREELKKMDFKNLLVRGKDGEFDERIRVALAVKWLADEGDLSEEILEKIIAASINVLPNEDLVKKKYVRKLISNYLGYKGH